MYLYENIFSYIHIFYLQFIYVYTHFSWASQVVLVVKNLPAIAGDVGDTVLIPGLGRFPEEPQAIHSSSLP